MRATSSVSRLVVPSIAMLGLTLGASSARAGGYYIGDVGTRGLGRGGAFIAAPDSLLAIHYNPAALSLLRGLHFEADLSLVNLDFSFQRSCPCVDPSMPNSAELDRELESQFRDNPARTNSPLAIPFVGVGYGFEKWDLTVAFAAWGPNSGNYKFGQLPATSASGFEQASARTPERYTALGVDTLEANFAFGFGLQPLRGLRVGGTAMVYQNAHDQNLHLWVNSASFATQPESPTFDIPLRFKFHRGFALNWSVGASYEVVSGLSVGAAFRGKRSIRSKGSIDIQLPDFLRELGQVEGSEIELEINTPPLTNVGVQYALPGVFKAEAAFVYEYWKTYDRIVILPKDIVVTLAGQSQALGPIIMPRGWNSTYSLRFGGELNLFEPGLGLRAGYFYEPSAIPPEQLDASRLDLDKHGFALGLATSFWGAKLEVSAMYVALQSVNVTNSNVKVTAPLDAPIGSREYITTIGNGRYDGRYLIGSASLSYALD